MLLIFERTEKLQKKFEIQAKKVFNILSNLEDIQLVFMSSKG